MESINISGAVREIAARSSEQSRALKALRKSGYVPCELYGQGENIHFSVKATDINKLIFTPNIYAVNLNIDGKEVKAILKDFQQHPVKDNVLHADFYQITDEQPIVMEVPVKLEGLAEGVKAGGKLSLQVRRLRVRALCANIPERLTVDVTNLGLGKTIKVGELSYDNLELLNAKEAVVCAVKLTRSARGAAAAAGAATEEAAAE